jgi:hypothetical protein
LTTTHSPAKSDAVVKGLAKHGNRLRHDQTVKYVDANPYKKGGYSPMTERIVLDEFPVVYLSLIGHN